MSKTTPNILTDVIVRLQVLANIKVVRYVSIKDSVFRRRLITKLIP